MAHYWRIVRSYRHSFVVSPQWHSTSFILLAILPFWQGYSLAGSLRGMLRSPRQQAPCWCPLHGTSLSAFVSGRGAGDPYRIRPCHRPVTRYMVDVSRWSSGSAVHRANGDSGERIRLLMLGVASTAGQLLGSVLIDELIPSLGNTVYPVTIIGTLFALVGAIVTTIPEYRASKMAQKNGGVRMKGFLQTVTGPVTY